MEKSATLKRLFNEYTKKYIKKIVIAVFFSLLVAASTSSIAWLLDPAIDKIFIQKDQSLLIIIPFLRSFFPWSITLLNSLGGKSLRICCLNIKLPIFLS